MKTLSTFISHQLNEACNTTSDKRVRLRKIIEKRRKLTHDTNNNDLVTESFFGNIAKLVGVKSDKVENKVKTGSEKLFGKFANKGKALMNWVSKTTEDTQKKIQEIFNSAAKELNDDKKRLAMAECIDMYVKAAYMRKKADKYAEKYNFNLDKDLFLQINDDDLEKSANELKSLVLSV